MATKKTKNKNSSPEVNPIEVEINNFIEKMFSFHDVVPLLIALADFNYVTKHKKLNSFMQKHGKKVRGKKDVYSFQGAALSKVKKFSKEMRISRNAYYLTPQSFFVTMLSVFDGYIYIIVKELLRKTPEKLISDTKSLTYNKILKHKNLDAVLEYILSQELEDFSHKGISEQLLWLQKKFDVPLQPDTGLWQKVVEINERRNIIVHCDGKVSQKYLDNCKRAGIKLGKEYKVGYSPEISLEYFTETCDILIEFGLKIIHVLWRRVEEEDKELSDDNLTSDIAIELLERESYSLATRVLEFAYNDFDFVNDLSRRICCVNYALALKGMGKEKEALEALDGLDWSSSKDYVVMVVEVVRGNFDKAASLMELVNHEGGISGREPYSQWPAFKEFKKSKVFLKTFKKVYGKDFLESSSLTETEEALVDTPPSKK